MKLELVDCVDCMQVLTSDFLDASPVLDRKTFLYIWDALRDLVPCVQFKKTVKTTHGGVLLLVKLQAL